MARQAGARCCAALAELIETRPDYIVEAASAEAVKQIALPCLRAQVHLIVLSTGAFSDEHFLKAAIAAADENARRIYVASGAIGGLDLVQSALIGGKAVVRITTEKPPHALRGAPGLREGEPSAVEVQDVFRGTAREAIQRFPQNVNVAVTLALAGQGLDRTMVIIRSNPALTRNRHVVELEGAFGRARVEVEADASQGNPKSSALAADSVLALLKRLASPLRV